VIKLFKQYSNLHRSIYILFLAQVINSAGSFVFPFLAIYLSNNLNLNEALVGFYVTLSTTVNIIGTLIGGKLTDYLGRKKVIIMFSSLAVLSLVPCAYLTGSYITVWLLILTAFFNGGVHPAIDAMVIDLTNKDNRKYAFSLLNIGVNVGFAVGPLIAGFLYNKHLEWLFLGDAGTIFLSLLLVIIYVKDTIPSDKMITEHTFKNDGERAEVGGLITAFLKRPVLVMFTFIFSIYSFAYVQTEFSIPMYLMELFKDNGSKVLGSIMTTNALIVITLTMIIIRLTEKIKPIYNVAIAGVFYAIGFGMIYLINSFPMFLLSTVIWTVGEIMASNYSKVYIASHTPVSHRGRFSSIVLLITRIGFIVGPLATGKVIELYSIKIVWPIIFFMCIGTTLCMYLLSVYEENIIKGKAEEYSV
jgi:MFS family permease